MPTERLAGWNGESCLDDCPRRSSTRDQRPDVPAVVSGLETLLPLIECPASRNRHGGALRFGLEHLRRAAEELEVVCRCARSWRPGEALRFRFGRRPCPTCPRLRGRFVSGVRRLWHGLDGQLVSRRGVGACGSSAQIDLNAQEQGDSEGAGHASREDRRPPPPHPRDTTSRLGHVWNASRGRIHAPLRQGRHPRGAHEYFQAAKSVVSFHQPRAGAFSQHRIDERKLGGDRVLTPG